MVSAASGYTQYFKEDVQVNAGIKLADGRLVDLTGMVRFIENDRLTLELFGDEAPGQMDVPEGAIVHLNFWSGWSSCRCTANLAQKIYGRRVFLRLTGKVVEKQTRDYFRLDVAIPVSYIVPEEQRHTELLQLWDALRDEMANLPAPVFASCRDGFKAVKWNGQGDIMPQQLNLSGGGIRFRTGENIEPHTLIMICIFLPTPHPRVFPVVAEILRCSEIVLGREKGPHFISACRFQAINEKDRENIIAFIFSEQRRILNTFAGKR